jgi:hypothetical protein
MSRSSALFDAGFEIRSPGSCARARYRWLLLVALVTACYSPEPRAGAPCEDDSGCPAGQSCIRNICGGSSATIIDAAAIDGALEDGQVDASPDAAIDAPPPGFCVDAADCPSSNPCETVACTDNQCVATTRPNGASCGAAAANRCCGGACVNISNDENNCGGCGQACFAGRTCESVAVTTACPKTPAATTGRCRCAGANAECPDGQICRTLTPAKDRCTPEGVGDCAAGQLFVDVTSCPNFCRY